MDDIIDEAGMDSTSFDSSQHSSGRTVGLYSKFKSLLNDSEMGKRLTAISALTSVLVGSVKIYNFCVEINQKKLKNKAKIMELQDGTFIDTRSDVIAQGIKAIIMKLDEMGKSVDRYDHELSLLKKAKSESEQVFVYLSTETYMPMTQSYSEYEKLKAEIRKLKGQMLSCRNFFK